MPLEQADQLVVGFDAVQNHGELEHLRQLELALQQRLLLVQGGIDQLVQTALAEGHAARLRQRLAQRRFPVDAVQLAKPPGVQPGRPVEPRHLFAQETGAGPLGGRHTRDQ